MIGISKQYGSSSIFSSFTVRFEILKEAIKNEKKLEETTN